MHILQQIEPTFGIGLGCSGKALKCLPELIRGIAIKRIGSLTWLHNGFSLD